MSLTRIQSPVVQHPPAEHVQAQTLAHGGSSRRYRYFPGGEAHVTPEDAAWIVANMQGWTLIGPVEEPPAVEEAAPASELKGE